MSKKKIRRPQQYQKKPDPTFKEWWQAQTERTRKSIICALIALPDGIFWLPDALAEGGYYWRWLIEDSMPMLIAAAGGIGCLFGAHKLRTGNRLRKKIANIVAVYVHRGHCRCHPLRL